MKKTKEELRRSRTATKAAHTRKTNRRREEYIRRGTIGQLEAYRSEMNYIDELVGHLNIKRENVFHHNGMPDLMVIADDGKIRFYEIKRKTGSSEMQKLKSDQKETIKKLLRNAYVEEVNLVRYQKQKRLFCYDSPIRISESSIDQYSAT